MISRLGVRGATLAGAVSVIVWGANLPLARLVEPYFGLPVYLAAIFLTVGFIGILRQRVASSTRSLDLAGFTSPYFWLRGGCFLFHEIGVNVAVTQVTRENVPFILLLNYFWPTAIILCSIAIAGVRVYRPTWFVIGTLVVTLSLALEILGPAYLGKPHHLTTSDMWLAGLTFLGAISWGLYSALTKRFGEISGGSRATPFYQVGVGILAPLVLLTMHAGPVTSPGISSMFAYGALSFLIISQFVAFKCWDLGVSRGSIVVLSLFADFIPWISLFFAALLLGAEIGWLTIVSAVSLVIGAMLTRVGTIQREGRERNE